MLNNLLINLQGKSERDQLELVNIFFNSNVLYSSDLKTWGVSEYWATREELLQRKAGDCEDFAIAKYYTLIDAGIQEEKLKLLYCRQIPNSAHMVLLYCDSEILVLDNSVDNILSLIDRSDLTPILGFNFMGIWTFKRDEMKLVTTNSKKLVKWRQFQEKLIRYDAGGL